MRHYWGVNVASVPEALFDDPEAEARWRARFTAPRVSLPQWARDAPDRCLYTSNGAVALCEVGASEIVSPGWSDGQGQLVECSQDP